MVCGRCESGYEMRKIFVKLSIRIDNAADVLSKIVDRMFFQKAISDKKKHFQGDKTEICMHFFGLGLIKQLINSN